MCTAVASSIQLDTWADRTEQRETRDAAPARFWFKSAVPLTALRRAFYCFVYLVLKLNDNSFFTNKLKTLCSKYFLFLEVNLKEARGCISIFFLNSKRTIPPKALHSDFRYGRPAKWGPDSGQMANFRKTSFVLLYEQFFMYYIVVACCISYFCWCWVVVFL